MGIKEQMDDFENQKQYVYAEFKGAEGLELDIKADFMKTLTLAMALLEQCAMRDKSTVQQAMLLFVREQLGER